MEDGFSIELDEKAVSCLSNLNPYFIKNAVFYMTVKTLLSW